MTFAALWRTLSHFLNHPLGRRDRFGTLMRIVRWQIGSRTLGTAVAVPFVDGTRLLIRAGMHGATGNVYVGLMEYEDMAFVLHLLRKDVAFLDVGANVGVYSILAAGRGANVLAIEPVPGTYEQLLDNIHLNRFHDRIDARNMGVGSEPGALQFSTQTGPTNHVLAPGEAGDHAVTVTVDALDTIAAGWAPTMIKIDVEGFEANVIRGAAGLLAQTSLQAVLIELNGLGARYGFSDTDIHAQLLKHGFSPAHYDPVARQLHALEDHRTTGNTLYVRPSIDLDQRLRQAQPFVWGEMSI
jgi:FkbM family methyltransferase